MRIALGVSVKDFPERIKLGGGGGRPALNVGSLIPQAGDPNEIQVGQVSIRKVWN
jgi:hypothetical protein